MFSIEPKRQTSIDTLFEPFHLRVAKLLYELEQRCFDPIVFEAKRTQARQKWLYGVGRTHSKNRKPVTWTMQSRHLDGKACDIISRKRGWDHPAFFDALKVEAEALGLRVIPQERCHVEYRS